MADIQYLNYGDLQIELLALLNNLANQVLDYVSKQSWSNKRKEKFMSAYSDLMNRGILGASNSTGQWVLNVGGDSPVPLDTMSRKDKEMYQEAAYFIQQQMASLPTKASLEEKEETDKSKLPIFDHSTFKKGFLNQLSNDYFGGSDEIKTSSWDEYDKRDDKGIRGRTERAKMLIGSLERYALNLELNKDKYNFEGSPFGSLDEFKNRIAAARKALIETPDDTDDDFRTLNALGLNASEWFNNGSGDPSGQYIKLADGTLRLLSYAELNEYNLELAKIKEEENAKLLKKKLQEAYNNTLFLNRVTNPKMLGLNPVALKEKYKDGNSLLAALQGYALKDIRTLTPDELSEVHGAYKNLANEPIDNDLLNRIKNSSSGFYKDSAPNRFRKIKGIDNLIWDSKLKLVIQLNNRQQQLAILNQPTDLFKGVLTKEDIQNTPISKEGWTSADTADVVSMIGDLVSLGGFWANIGGTATSLTSDLYADISRGKNLGDILKGVGVNLGWGLAGMLPGAKSTKLVARAARLVPKAWMLAQSAGIVMDPEVQKSAMKFTTVDGLKTVSSKDLENLKYLFHAVTGGTNIVKSHYRAKQYRETINKQSVKTADGKTVKLSDKEIAEVNKAGRKGGLKAALDKFKEYAKSEAAEGQFKFSENGKSKFNPTRYSSILSKFTSDNKLLKGKQIIDTEQLNNLLQEDKNRSWYHWNKGYPRFELTPFRNIFRKDFDNSKLISSASGEESPYAKKPLELGKVKTTNHIEGLPDKSGARETTLRREIMKRYLNVMDGKFSNKEMLGGKESIKIGNEDVRVYTSKYSDGTPLINISTSKGNHNFKSLEEAKKFIASIVKELKNNITKGPINKNTVKEIGKILQDLKRKGWLREGGKIDKQRIQKYKEFINK